MECGKSISLSHLLHTKTKLEKKIDTLIGDKQFRTQPKEWSAPPLAAHSSPPQQWLHVYAYHLSGCPYDFLVIVGQNLNNQHTAVKRS